MKHAERHPSLDVIDCFGCKVASVQFTGVHRLQQEREAGVTQAEMAKDTIAQAKKDGREIQSKRRWI